MKPSRPHPVLHIEPSTTTTIRRFDSPFRLLSIRPPSTILLSISAVDLADLKPFQIGAQVFSRVCDLSLSSRVKESVSLQGYLKFCFSRMYGHEVGDSVFQKVKEVLQKLFDSYKLQFPIPLDAGESTSQSDLSSHNDDDDDSWSSAFRLKVKKKQIELKKNELDRYLDDEVEDDYEGFDILKWWKGKKEKYYVLSCMARDILAIPVSAVSSESAFSNGGRILDPFHSSLSPSTMEALICAQNWLRSPKKHIDLRSQMDEIEFIESVKVNWGSSADC